MDLLQIAEIRAQLKSERHQHDTVWAEIADFCLPHVQHITSVEYPGTRNKSRIVIDTQAQDDAGRLAGFLQSQMFPPTGDWLRIELARRIRLEEGIEIEAQSLLDEVAEELLQDLDDSNFYAETTQTVLYWLVFGNAVMLIEEKPPKARRSEPGNTFGGFRFHNIAPWKCLWRLSSDEQPEFFSRDWKITRDEVRRRFGRLPASVQGKSYDDPRIEITHVITPAEDGGFLSEWLCCGDQQKMERLKPAVKIQFFPYVIARMHCQNSEQEGRGLGHVARPHAATINQMRIKLLNSAGRILDPPLIVNDDTTMRRPPLPGTLGVSKPMQFGQAPYYLQSGADLVGAREIAAEDRDSIRRIFKAELLVEPETQPRSAEETIARRERLLQQFGTEAVLVDSRFLRPAITLMLSVKSRSGGIQQFGRLASLLGSQDADMAYRYTSPFFTAQKAGVLARVRSLLFNRAEITTRTQNPIFLDQIDETEFNILERELAGVPARMFKTPEEMQEIGESRAALASAELQIQAAQAQGQLAQQGVTGGA